MVNYGAKLAIGFVIGLLLLGPIGALLGALIAFLWLERPSKPTKS